MLREYVFGRRERFGVIQTCRGHIALMGAILGHRGLLAGIAEGFDLCQDAQALTERKEGIVPGRDGAFEEGDLPLGERLFDAGQGVIEQLEDGLRFGHTSPFGTRPRDVCLS